jgi:hypothetical protein
MKLLGLVVPYIAVALFGAAALAKLPHVLYGKRIAGQVVDADSGQPIAGAHVVFLWQSPITPSGFTGHNSRTICYHAAAAITDQQGRFGVESWREWSTYSVTNQDPIALIYAQAHIPIGVALNPGPKAVEPPSDRTHERFALKGFNGNADQRIHMLFWGLANQDCMYGGESQKNLYPMLKAIHAEASHIASTQEHQNTVRIIAELAAEAALARNPNASLNEGQKDVFIREHLR